MELRHLRYFVSVAEAASVSRAASRINVSQPALSRQIRDLETELNVRLFDRVGRRIQLTAEGEDLLDRSRDVLARAASLSERAGALSGGAVGTLRVGATPQTMQSVVAGFLTRYRRSRPGVEVHLTEAGGVRLLDLVARGELHLTVRHLTWWIQTLAPDRTDQALGKRILPGAVRRRDDFVDAHTFQEVPKVLAVGLVTVA